MNVENAEKVRPGKRNARVQKISVLSMIVFTIATILHIYFFEGNWSFITMFFTADPLPWIMLLFLVVIGLCFYVTYHYFRKFL